MPQKPAGGWPKPTVPQPPFDELEEMSYEGSMQATDGCEGLEDDGVCEHGYPSWLLYLCLI